MWAFQIPMMRPRLPFPNQLATIETTLGHPVDWKSPAATDTKMKNQYECTPQKKDMPKRIVKTPLPTIPDRQRKGRGTRDASVTVHPGEDSGRERNGRVGRA